MELLRSTEASRGGPWLLAFMFGCFFGSVSCFGPNLDSEFTFLLPAGRSECFFQTAIRNGTMEVEYQVTAPVAAKQTPALSRVAFKCLYVWNLMPRKRFTGAFRFPVRYSDVKTLNFQSPPPPGGTGSSYVRLTCGIKVSLPVHICSSHRFVCGWR